MTIKHPQTVERYASQFAQMNLIVEQLQTFLATMPAPDENGNIPGIDYGYTGSVGRVHELLLEVSEIVHELGAE